MSRLPSIEDLKREAEKTEVGRLHWAIQYWNFQRPAYEDWADLVEDAVTHVFRLMAEARDDFNDLDEDALSSVLNTGLKMLNLSASAKSINGNCDVAVEHDTYKWLGEAKIAKDVSKIYHGYEQLTSRYGTGTEGQTRGGILLYVNHDNAKVTLAGWRDALLHELPECNARDGRVALSFKSDGLCAATGAAIEITHFALPLHHAPQEDKRRLSSGALKAAADARNRVRGELKSAPDG